MDVERKTVCFRSQSIQEMIQFECETESTVGVNFQWRNALIQKSLSGKRDPWRETFLAKFARSASVAVKKISLNATY